MKDILIIGSNPSSKNIDPLVPFLGTISGKMLDRWIEKLGIDERVVYTNVSTAVGNIKFIEEDVFHTVKLCGLYKRVIALGEKVSRVLDKNNIEHFKLPHPSGLNRKLNDKKYVEWVLGKCKAWLST